MIILLPLRVPVLIICPILVSCVCPFFVKFSVKFRYLIFCMQVRVYDVGTMSCSYVLVGHTDIVLCLDTCVLNTGEAYIVTGSKDNSVSQYCLHSGYISFSR